MNERTYDCPCCESDVPVAHDAERVTCPHCKTELDVDCDAESYGSVWRDLTRLVKAPDRSIDRKHVITSAGFWYRASRDETKSWPERLLCMEQAYNHAENALAHLRDRVPGVREALEAVTKGKE